MEAGAGVGEDAGAGVGAGVDDVADAGAGAFAGAEAGGGRRILIVSEIFKVPAVKNPFIFKHFQQPNYPSG